jgi:hypothetical protein
MQFKLRPTKLNMKKITGKIRMSIRERLEKKVYEHLDLSRVMGWQLHDIRDQDPDATLLPSCLSILQHSWAIDINDFIIPHKKRSLGLLALAVKKILWKLLKFYTFRLFSQQRELNVQAVSLLSLLHAHYQKKILLLQAELDSLKPNEN